MRACLFGLTNLKEDGAPVFHARGVLRLALASLPLRHSSVVSEASRMQVPYVGTRGSNRKKTQGIQSSKIEFESKQTVRK